MLSNKRSLCEFESPEASYKRRRVFGQPEVALQGRSAWPFGGENVATHGNGVLPGAPCREAASFHQGAKRRRECDGGAADSSELAFLRRELETLREEATRKVAQTELVNQNLKTACEEQQKELLRMQQENKLLKRSVLSLNAKREEAEREANNAKQIASQCIKHLNDMHQAGVARSIHQRGWSSCGQDNWTGHGSGGGPVC